MKLQGRSKSLNCLARTLLPSAPQHPPKFSRCNWWNRWDLQSHVQMTISAFLRFSKFAQQSFQLTDSPSAALKTAQARMVPYRLVRFATEQLLKGSCMFLRNIGYVLWSDLDLTRIRTCKVFWQTECFFTAAKMLENAQRKLGSCLVELCFHLSKNLIFPMVLIDGPNLCQAALFCHLDAQVLEEAESNSSVASRRKKETCI